MYRLTDVSIKNALSALILTLLFGSAFACNSGSSTKFDLQVYLNNDQRSEICDNASAFRIGGFEMTSDGYPSSTILWQSKTSDIASLCGGSSLVINPATTGKPTVIAIEALNSAGAFGSLPDAKTSVIARGLSEGVIYEGTKDVKVEIVMGETASFSQVKKWRDEVVLPKELKGHTATALLDHKILIVGGVSTKSGNPQYLANSYLYDPSKLSVTELPNNPGNRAYHTATLLDDGRVLIVGGERRIGSGIGANLDVFIYDPSTLTFENVGTLPVGRFAHQAVKLQDGTVLIIGGKGYDDAGATIFLNDAYLFIPRTETTGDGVNPNPIYMTKSRSDFGAVLLASGKVMVQGGKTLGYEDPSLGYVELTTANVEIYDPNTNSFVETKNFDQDTELKIGLSRYGHKLAHLEDIQYDESSNPILTEKVAVIGGAIQQAAGDEKFDTTVYILDVDGSKFCTPPIQSEGTFDRRNFSLTSYVVDKKTAFLAAGGQAAGSFKADAVIFSFDPLFTDGPKAMPFCGWAKNRTYSVLQTENKATVVPMKFSHAFHAAVNMNNGQILIVGGISQNDDGSSGETPRMEVFITPVSNNDQQFSAYEY